MLEPGMVEFSASVAGSSNRQTSTKVLLEMKPVDVLRIGIVPASQVEFIKPEGDAYDMIINPNGKLFLLFDVPSTSANSITTDWKVHGTSAVSLTDASVAPLGATSSNLILNPDSLSAGQEYKVDIDVTNTATGAKGTSHIKVKTNSPPSGGTCAVSPTTGLTLTTKFTVTCDGWADDTIGALSYGFYLVRETGTEALEPPAPRPRLEFFAPGIEGSVVIQARVIDDMGAFTARNMSVGLTDGLAASDDRTASIQQISQSGLADSVAKGDAAGVFRTLASLGAALAGANTNATNASVASSAGGSTGGGRRLLASPAPPSAEALAAAGVAAGLIHTLDVATQGGIDTSPDTVLQKTTSLRNLVAPHTTLFNTTTLSQAFALLARFVEARAGLEVTASLGTAIIATLSVLRKGVIRPSPNLVNMTLISERVEQIVAGGVLKTAGAGEPPQALGDPTDALSVQKRARSQLSDAIVLGIAGATGVASGGVNISLPGQEIRTLLPAETSTAVDDGGTANAVDLLVSGTATPWPKGPGLSLRSHMFGLSLLSGGSPVAVQGLSNKVAITMDTTMTSTEAQGGECRYWTGSVYSKSGCDSTPIVHSDGRVECRCNHLTSFAVSQGLIPCPTTTAADCSGHGNCQPSTGTCQCQSMWGGESCHQDLVAACPFTTNTNAAAGANPCYETSNCPWSQGISTAAQVTPDCVAKVVRPYCDASTYQAPGCWHWAINCTADCTSPSHGLCNYTSGECNCQGRFLRPACAIADCPGNCTGRGQCDVHTGLCACPFGYIGSACEIETDLASTETWDFQLTQAPTEICRGDTFTATIDIASTAKGRPALFTAGVKAQPHMGVNGTLHPGAYHSVMPLPVQTAASWRYTLPFPLSQTGSYELIVNGTDSLGRGGVYNLARIHHFSVVTVPKVAISLPAAYITTTRTQDLVLRAAVARSSCVDPGVSLIFNWTLVAGSFNGTGMGLHGDQPYSIGQAISLPSTLSLTRPSLSIPKGTLQPGMSYTVLVEAAYGGFVISSKKQATAHLTVTPTPIAVAIEQGSAVSISSGGALQLDAQLTDTDGSGAVSYEWSWKWGSFTQVVPGSVLIIAAGILQVTAPATSVEVIATVTATKAGGITPPATSICTVTVLRGEIPTVRLSTDAITSLGSVDATNAVTLLATVTWPGSVPTQVGALWSAYNSTGGSWSLPASAVMVTWPQPSLILPPNSLLANTAYTLKLGVYNSTHDPATGPAPTGFSTVRLETNSPPKDGSFAANAAATPVVVRESEVTFSAANWVDRTADSPLEYAFGYRLGTGGAVVLTGFGSSKLFVTKYLPAGTVTPVLWVKDRHGSQTEATASTLVVTEPAPSAAKAASALSDFNAANADSTETLAFVQSVGNSLSKSSDAKDTTAAREATGSMLDLLLGVQAGNDIIPVAMTLSTLAIISQDPLSVSDASLLDKVDTALSASLAASAASGLSAESAGHALDAVGSVVQATISVPGRASQASASKTESFLKSIGSALMKNLGTNANATSLTSLNADGTPALLLGVRKATSSAFQGSEVKLSQMEVKLPSGDFLSNAAAGSGAGGRRLLSSGATSNDPYEMQVSWINPAGNPYSYDTSKVLRSGVTSVFFTKGDVVQNVSGLAPGNEIELEIKLSSPASAPLCYYRAATQYDSDGVVTTGLEPVVHQSSVGEAFKCKLSHLTDFVIGEGCNSSSLCSSHGLCRQDSTCQCQCGWSNASCNVLELPILLNASKLRVPYSAPARIPVQGVNGTGFVAMVPKATSAAHSCVGAASGTVLPISGNQVQLPSGVGSFAAGTYTVCLCNAKNGCATDCDFHHNGQETLTIVPLPRMGPPASPGDIRVQPHRNATFRVTASIDEALVVRQGDVVFIQPAGSSCSAGAATANSADSSPWITLNDYQVSSRSATFRLPSTLAYAAGGLQLCYATKESYSNGLLHHDEVVPLPDKIVFSNQHPTLGGGVAMRSIAAGHPDFAVSTEASVGDFIFFAYDCGSVDFTGTASRTPPLPVNAARKIELPRDVPLFVENAAVALLACWATRESEGDVPDDYVTLGAANNLNLHPQPSIAPQDFAQGRGLVFEMKVVQGIPALAGSQAGDVVVLALDCAKAHSSKPFAKLGPLGTPQGPSGRLVLSADGTTTMRGLALARLSELDVGTYQVCYATAASGADSDADFAALVSTVNVFVSLRHPEVTVPRFVQLGADIVVQWQASNGNENRLSKEGDFVALYRKGECLARDQGFRHSTRAGEAPPGSSYEGRAGPREDQNKCFLQAVRLPEGHAGGEVRFYPADYKKLGGEYDVRFFEGDSRHGDGLVCRGHKGITQDAPPVLVCALEATVVSRAIEVTNHMTAGSVNYYEHEPNALPGMEMYCRGTRDCTRLTAPVQLTKNQRL